MGKFKSWFLLLFGIAIWVCDFIHYFGFYKFPNPNALSNDWQGGIALIIGGIAFFVSVSKLTSIFEKKAGDLIDKVGK